LTAQYAHANQYTIRVDHELRPGKDHLRLFGWTADTITPHLSRLLRPNPTAGTPGNLVHSRTISPTMFNEVRLAITAIGYYCAAGSQEPLGPLSCNDIAQKQCRNNITGIGTVRDVNVYPGDFFHRIPTAIHFATWEGQLKLGAAQGQEYPWHTASYIPVHVRHILTPSMTKRSDARSSTKPDCRTSPAATNSPRQRVCAGRL
jgi:hypothetical protein